MGLTFLKEISFKGFKSFGDQEVHIKLDKGFTAIIGPNGSGKSNIIDGLCFALGRLSKKTMRAENLTDLIFVGTKTKKPATRAEVAITFDNSENVFQGYIGQDITISREVNDKGKSVYRMNGGRTTRENILMVLALANVDPDGFNFILQGKITEMTHLSPEDRRIFIEDLVGLQKFDEEKAAALKELEKADQDLIKFEAIFNEVAKQLAFVKKERDDALRWLELDKQIKELNARLIALSIKKLRDEEEQLLVFIGETKKKIEEIEEDISRCGGDVDKENAAMDTLTQEIDNLESNRNDLEQKVSNLRSELSSKKTELKILSESMDKLQERKQALVDKQEALEESQTYDKLLEQVQDEIDSANIQISKTRSEIQDRENEETRLESDITIFQQELNAFNKKLNTASSSKSSLETELKMTQDRLVKLESKKASLEKDLSKLLKDKNEDIDQAMAGAQQEAKDIQDAVEAIKLELKKEQQKQKGIESQIEQVRTQAGKVDKQLNDNQSKISVAKSEQEYFEKQINSIKHDAKTLEVNKSQFAQRTKELAIELKKFKENLDQKTEMLESMKAERVNIEKDIEGSQKEYEGAEEEIFGVMKNLEMLTENYSSGMSELKSEIQADGLDAIEDSMLSVKDYVQDLLGMIETIKDLEAAGEKDEIEEGFKSMDMFIENVDDTLTNLKSQVQDKINALVNSSSSKFSDFMKDLLEIMSQVHIALRKLKMTRNTEQINALHELDKKKSELTDEIGSINVTYTKTEGDLKQAALEVKNNENKLKSFETQIADLSSSIEGKNQSIAEFEEKIEALNQQKNDFQADIDEKTKSKDEFWEITNQLNTDMEDQNAKLQEVQDRVRGLQTVQKLIKDIDEHEAEITESNAKIATDTEKVEALEEEITTIDASKAEKEAEIQTLRKQKEEVSQTAKDLRTHLEEENKDLQAKQKRHGQVTAMIAREKEIGEIDAEIEDTDQQIKDGDAAIADLGDSITKIDQEKAEVVAKIGDLNNEKQSHWERQKELQEELSKLNTSLGTNNNKLANFQARKTEIGTKIEELFTQSAEFGTLPEVLEGWTETEIKADIGKAQEDKKILEPVNLKSIEQYEVVKNRFDDIDLRRQGLQRERKSILENIERIELEKTRQFMRAYNEINTQFSDIFQKLSPGGIANMILENPSKPFEGGVFINARPRGKKINSIESLSGGEKTLVALAFIFAVEKFQPSPFYVMDEIDAALDGPNVHKVSMVIKEFASASQFIVISHREENIVNADKIYGVSMKDSITDIFSIKMDDVEVTDAPIETPPADEAPAQ
jgi:chromosome segregation protein